MNIGDILFALISLIFNIMILPTLLDKRTFVRRSTSASYTVGVSINATLLLLWFNAPITAIVSYVGAAEWAIMFAFRGKGGERR